MQVSVIIPTLNEAGNLSNVVAAVTRVLAGTSIPAEILIADGGSTDGTRTEARVLESRAAVRLVEAASGRGLAGDVLVAARHARAEVIVVMDADGSHDPRALPRLVRPVLDGTRDMVIGSRYVHGGRTPGWPASRRLLSRAAALLAWPWVDVKDPTSGFFALRRHRLLAVDPGAYGFKIGLEVLLAGDEELRVAEVPICFRDRFRGHSKMGAAQARAYVARLVAFAAGP